MINRPVCLVLVREKAPSWKPTLGKLTNFYTPTYLADLCRPVASVGGRQGLRSATRGDLVISPTITYFGAQSFTVTGPKAWNQLPADIRAIDSVNSFKSALKTFLLC